MRAAPPRVDPRLDTSSSSSGMRSFRSALAHGFSWLLLVATAASLLSTVCFIGYLVLTRLVGTPSPARYVVLYTLGIVGLGVAEACQILGVVDLIVQWIVRHNVAKKPREIVVLLLSLIPYMVVVIFLITLIVYLRARRKDPRSQRTAEAAEELKREVMDAFVDFGTNSTSSAAGTPSATSATSATFSQRSAATVDRYNPPPPTVERVAIYRVVGPVTARQVDRVPSPLVVAAMIALLVSLVVVPVVALAAPAPFQTPRGVTTSSPVAAATATPTATALPTATSTTAPTATPKPAPTATPTSAPTATSTPPRPTPTPTPPPAGIIKTFSGLTSGSGPTAIVSGPDGDLWFTEQMGRKIGRVTPSGAVAEFPASGPPPIGITVGPNNSLWYTQAASTFLGRITTSGAITEFSEAVSPGLGVAIAADRNGNLWYMDDVNSPTPVNLVIAEVSSSGTLLHTYAAPALGSPQGGIVLGPDGNLWFTDTSADQIDKLNPATGAITAFALATGSQPTAITVGPDGNLWFAQQGSGQIGRITTGGSITEFNVPNGASAGLSGIAAGPDGYLWFTEQTGNKVGRMTTAGVVITYPVPASSGPTGMTRGPNGEMWFTLFNTAEIGESTT